MSWIRRVTEGCTHDRIVVTGVQLAGGRADSPIARPPLPAPPGRHGFPRRRAPPNAEAMALSVYWNCPPEMRDIVLHFYLVDDRIVRVAYVLPPVVAPSR
jgi:hypothetical protein